MNQGPRYVRLMEKSRGKKSRATVPLIMSFDQAATGKKISARREGPIARYETKIKCAVPFRAQYIKLFLEEKTSGNHVHR
jgi:hypothetical protein